MQVQGTNPTNTVNAASAQQDESIPLSERAGAAASTTAADPNGADMTVVYNWLIENQGIITIDPKMMSKMLLQKIKEIRNEDGSKPITSISNLVPLMQKLAAACANDGPRVVDFIHKEQVKLAGLNLILPKFVERAIFPSEENGGKPREW
ncbi:hypothetical protein AAKU67_002730 [Oxalobacteraceae bacterium GrIS 2.11]